MEELDRNVKKGGRFRQLIPAKKSLPSHDAARQALVKWDLESHRANHQLFIAKFKHNKGLDKGKIDGWRVAAIDVWNYSLAKAVVVMHV